MTWAVVVLVLLVAANVAEVSAVYTVPGMLVVSAATMSLTMNLTDHQRFAALLFSCGTAAFAVVLGTWVADDPLLKSLTFLGLGVATLVAVMIGPTAVVAALAAIVGYYAMSLVPATWERLPGHLISAISGAALSAVLLGVLLREQPAVQARRLWFSVASAWAHLAGTQSTGRSRYSARTISRRVDVVLAAVSAAKAHLTLYPEVWPASFSQGGDATLTDLAIAAEERALWTTLPTLTWPEPLAPVSTRNVVEATDPGGRAILSMGAQLLTATVLSLLAAQLIDPVHWFWCVLAALVMLFGTSSAADSIGKGLRRVLGTATALPLGVVLADLAGTNLLATAVVVVGAMFFQQYFADTAYGVSIFFLTVLLAVLLSAAGAPTLASLEARLLLTTVGASIGITVALTVMPTRTGALLRGRALGVIQAAESTVASLRAQAEPATVAGFVDTTARRIDLLRKEAQAARKGWPFSAHHHRAALQIAGAVDAARQLREVSKLYQQHPVLTSTAEYQAAQTLNLLHQARAKLDPTVSRDSSNPILDEGDHLGRLTEAVCGQDPLAASMERLRVLLRSLLLQLS